MCNRNNQMFIMGGVTQGANTTIDVVQADFESVLGMHTNIFNHFQLIFYTQKNSL